MRKFIIDTDTASDDVIAIIAALKEKTVDVLALTVVAGNVSLNQATQNALTAIEVSNTYQPLVYKGADKPLYRPLYKAENVHGDDGMGNMHLPASKLKVEEMHAVDALIELIEKNPHEIELITLGPLTNVALACMKAPDVMAKLKSMTLMAGTGVGPGNVTPYAEFNVYVDAQSLDIVLQLDVPKLFVGWDAITQGAFITDDEVSYLKNSGSNLATFALRCTKSLYEFNKRIGNDGFDLADPTAMLVALYPDILTKKIDAFTRVEFEDEEHYGHVLLDETKLPNATICTEINSDLFKKHLFEMLIAN